LLACACHSLRLLEQLDTSSKPKLSFRPAAEKAHWAQSMSLIGRPD
jgi:hypothetical protein